MIYIAVLCNPKITAEPLYNTPPLFIGPYAAANNTALLAWRPSQGTNLYCLVNRGTLGVNNLPRVVARIMPRSESNPRSLDHESNALPLHHRVTWLYGRRFLHVKRPNQQYPSTRDGILEDWPRPRGHLEDKILWPWPWHRRPLALASTMRGVMIATACTLWFLKAGHVNWHDHWRGAIMLDSMCTDVGYSSLFWLCCTFSSCLFSSTTYDLWSLTNVGFHRRIQNDLALALTPKTSGLDHGVLEHIPAKYWRKKL